MLSRRAREAVEALLDNEAALEMAERTIAFHATSSRGRFTGAPRRALAVTGDSLRRTPFDLVLPRAADAPEVARFLWRVPARLELDCGDIAESLIAQTSDFRAIQTRVNDEKKAFINGVIGDMAHEYGLAMHVPYEEAKQWIVDNIPGAEFLERWWDVYDASNLAHEAFAARLSLTATVAMGYMQQPPCWPSNMVADVW